MKGLIYILIVLFFISGCSDNENKQVVSPPYGYKWGQSIGEFKNDHYYCSPARVWGYEHTSEDHKVCRLRKLPLSMEDVEDFKLSFYKGRLVSIEVIIAKSSDGKEAFNEKYNKYLNKMKKRYPNSIPASEYYLRNPSSGYVYFEGWLHHKNDKLSEEILKGLERDYIYTPENVEKKSKLTGNQIELKIHKRHRQEDNEILSIFYFPDNYDIEPMMYISF